MPRYLTAPKLALLLLIDTYTTLDLSAPARQAILDFLASRTLISSDFSSASLNDRFELATADDISGFADALSGLPAYVPGRSVYDFFLVQVWGIDGLVAVVDFVRRAVESVGPSSPPTAGSDGEASLPKISRASPLGQFIRRCNVEFTRLQFADAQALWSSFAAFRSSSYSTWATRNPEAAQKLQTSDPPWSSHSRSAIPAQTSIDDTSLLLSFSIHHLQKLGHRLPPGLKANLSIFLTQNLDANSQSLQHFLSFFEHWRAGQYTMALESLHRYFDYSIASHGPGGRDTVKDGNGSGIGGGGVRVYYQYALLHLSVLHADYERWEASVAAMEECVATARESQDTPCLLLALSWLLYLRQAHGNSQIHSSTHQSSDISMSFGNLAISSSTQADEINFLKTKAREMKYWSLLSSTLLDEGRGELACVCIASFVAGGEGYGNNVDWKGGADIKCFEQGNATPKALEHLLQARYLNTTHDLRTQMPATQLFQAAALERLGQSTLSHHLYTNIPILHATHIPLPERVRSGCRLAQSLEQRGDFSQAVQTLDELEQSLEQLGTLKSKQRIMGWRMVVHLKRELRRDDIRTATRCHQALQPFLALSSDPDLSFEIFALGVKLQIKQDRRMEALAAINERIRMLKMNASPDLAQTLTLLILKARTFVPSSYQYASQSTSPKAFSLALRAASTAQRFNLVPHLCEAIDLLGKILNDSGEYAAAKELVEGCLPVAIETHCLGLEASLYTTLTDSLIGLSNPAHQSPTTSSPSSPVKPSTSTVPSATLAQAEHFLDLAYSAYIRLSDHQAQLDCLIKKEILARFKGDKEGAEKAEGMFMQLLEEREAEMREERGGEGGDVEVG